MNAHLSKIDLYTSFFEAAGIGESEVWRDRRKSGLQLADFRIVDCQFNDWWYQNFIGVEFLGLINPYRKGWKGSLDIQPVRLTNTMVYRGRAICSLDLLLI